MARGNTETGFAAIGLTAVPEEKEITMRYEVMTKTHYNMRDAWFRLSYRVREGPAGSEYWFLVAMEELDKEVEKLSAVRMAA